jgi:hypothetical protein
MQSSRPLIPASDCGRLALLVAQQQLRHADVGLRVLLGFQLGQARFGVVVEVFVPGLGVLHQDLFSEFFQITADIIIADDLAFELGCLLV